MRVKPYLEFAILVWNPFLGKDIDKFESIQHKVTRLVPNLKSRHSNFRLEQFKLTSLETRRKRGDLIQFYKILHELDQAGNLRREGLCFNRDTGKICTSRDEFFLSRVIPGISYR